MAGAPGLDGHRSSTEREAPGAPLTPRELDVLQLIAQGMANRQIARGLGISEKTVKNHLSAIYAKIGAADRTQAAMFAVAAASRDALPPGGRDGTRGECRTAGRQGRPEQAGPRAGWPGPLNRPAGLTVRETDVLGLVTGGMTNRMIACALGISEKTVKNHLSAIYAKIGAADRTQAALYAVTSGLPAPVRRVAFRLTAARASA
ncbi:response regulator transcription factor [Streptomyces sp. NPDC048650]|uniref:response regulator transcription factor n=1 Tax=unclassified Streptomyces TaxID=2593676 RepID=UPI0037185CBF